ncbi:uncharacterized protein LOC134258280 [Saccostrea cucullata]|uniref:uncharacterized protein LOC134258280 n=1 Tax=Saccostrea cuccullata TaxID=36930 RepID=UPI002ED15815
MENMPQTESARQCSSVHGALTLKKEKVPSFRMSIIFIGISVCSISLGIIMIVYKDQDRDELNFAAKTGSPIWSGSMLLLSGIFCFVVSGKDVSYRDVASDGYYNGMVAYGIINVLSLFINIGAVLLCTLTVIISRGQVLNIFALIISIVMFDCNIVDGGYVVGKTPNLHMLAGQKTLPTMRDEWS